MRRLVAFILPPALLAAALAAPDTAAARQTPRPRNIEPAPQPPTDHWRFPRPPHEAELPAPGRGNSRPGETLSKEDRRLLGVPRDVKQAHADFLKRSRTGVVRLLPRGAFDKRVSLRGGGAYYSFDARTHEYGYGSDIELQRGDFSVGFAGVDFGFMVNLGDVPLEGVTPETEALKFMASYEPPRTEAEARDAARQFGQGGGRREGAWTYVRRLPAVVGNTYALRSVNYRYSDVLVAFRVLRRDDDGSVILLWRILKKYPTPTLQADAARR